MLFLMCAVVLVLHVLLLLGLMLCEQLFDVLVTCAVAVAPESGV